MKLNMENLKQIAKQLLTLNEGAMLTGSLALNLQNFKTRREPSDIDISMRPNSSVFKTLEGMVHFDCSDDYDESDYLRDSYKLGDVKIDVFFPKEKKYLKPNIKIIDTNLVTLVDWAEILKFKLEHAFDTEYHDEKHREDLIWLLQNNSVW